MDEFFLYICIMIVGKEFHFIIDKIFDGDVKGIQESEQLQVNCPKCQEREGLDRPDGKYNLEINTKKRVFRCWKCDEPKFSGSLGRLIKQFGRTLDYQNYIDYAGAIVDYSKNDDVKAYERVELPDEFIPFIKMDENNPSHLEAYAYMTIDRKIDFSLLKKYRIGFCTEGKYWGRIIIPSYDKDGELNYFVARGYKNQKIPYLNPKSDKDSIIFNEGYINWDSTIYVVEGVFEMLSFPVNTVPQLGKTLSKSFFEVIKRKKPNIIIIFDPDAFYNSVLIYQQLKLFYGDDYNKKLKFVKLEGNDDLDEIRKKSGLDGVVNKIRSAREIIIDDYFIGDKFFYKKKYDRRTY